MHYRTALFLFILIILSALLGYNYYARPFAQLSSDNQQPVFAPSPSPISEPENTVATALFNSLSTEEKIAQLIAFPLNLDAPESTQEADLAWISDHKPGMVTLFGTQVGTQSAQAAITAIKTSTSALVAVDHEGGQVQRLRGTGFTQLPNWQSLCANLTDSSSNLDSTALLAESAAELQQVGVDIVFAPVVDVASSSSILGSRACSSDPGDIITAASSYISVFQDHQIMPVIKHFPGIGSLEVDPHNNFDMVTLNEDDLLVFEELLDANPTIGVMTAHVGITNRLPDSPCSLSQTCLQELTSYYQSALLFTDALDMEAAGYLPPETTQDQPETTQDQLEEKPLEKRAMQAIIAGNDVLVFGPKVTEDQIQIVINDLVLQYQQNPQFQERVDRSVLKILNYR